MITKDKAPIRAQFALAAVMIVGVFAAIPGIAWNTFSGGTGSDEAAEIAVDGSGNVYTAGFSQFMWGTPVNAHAGEYDAYLSKMNNNGVKEWHTFLGGTAFDFAEDIALDSTGNIYVTGTSQATWGTPLLPFAGFYDVFVAKLRPDGVLLWNTFLGGGSDDGGYGVALDANGNVYITGKSYGWGTPLNPHAGGGSDVFIAKLNSSGALQWHTFLGAEAEQDDGFAIDVTPAGDIFIAGESDGAWGAPITPHDGCCHSDVFVAKLNSAGALQWNTFLGGDNSERGEGIALDQSGNIFVTGFSWWGWGTPLNPHSGGLTDAFVAKLNGNGQLQWHTFLGGTDDDNGRDITTDGSGNVYVTGYSGATWGTPLNAFAGYYDAFVAKLNSNGSRLWHTFLGNYGADYGHGIVVNSGKFYVTGYSSTTWGNPIVPFNNGTDAFIAKSDVEPATFSDVPNGYWAKDFVERLYNAGITGGCAANPLKYCPDGTVTRAQMAVFLERGIHGSTYNPPAVGPSTGFGDVQPSYWSAAWIKQLAADGITGGCGFGNYCPEAPVTRAQMAVFLLRSKHGASYSPPAAGSSSGFSDVPPTYWAAAWIKQLVAEGITAGCSTGNYCPEAPVTRAQMAVFLVRTFNLP